MRPPAGGPCGGDFGSCGGGGLGRPPVGSPGGRHPGLVGG